MSHSAKLADVVSVRGAGDVPPESREAIQLRWLRRIRWVVLASLFAIFFGANYSLELELPTRTLYLVLGILGLSNVALVFVRNPGEEYYAMVARSALLVDVLGLAILLYFCGGYTNPFSMMFLAYVTLAAVVVDARWTWVVFAVSLCCFFALFFYHVPLPQLGMHGHHGHHMHQEGFSLHLHGMLVAFVLIGVVIAFFVTRMSCEMAEQSAKIAELRRVEDERRRLASLATLTAGAAHELATPLATLSLIGEDLAERLGKDPAWKEDVEIMEQELRRCSGILQRMRGGGVELNGEAPRLFRLEDVLADLRGEFLHEKQEVQVAFEGTVPTNTDMYSLQQALASSLRALLRNAVQACSGVGSVVCRTEISDDEIAFSVQDSGPGMTEEVAERAGEPFFTSKEPGEGMGLGLYLTKLFARQVGGALSISSVAGKGTRVLLRIPRIMEVV
jgi:two-component system sensor histidine kinase RegB